MEKQSAIIKRLMPLKKNRFNERFFSERRITTKYSESTGKLSKIYVSYQKGAGKDFLLIEYPLKSEWCIFNLSPKRSEWDSGPSPVIHRYHGISTEQALLNFIEFLESQDM